ncbi:WD40 repeat-like protein [Xylaria nigripes]|nr:WD40 repeat-like protein [Xylaria nigripes]
MAANKLLGTATTTTQEIIDLTDDFPFPLLHLPVLPAPPRTIAPHLAASKEDNIPGQNGLSRPKKESAEDHTRPAKRRRIIVELASPEPSIDEHSHRRERVAAALGKCLEEQVFPHIERATETLPSDIYDLDKLGAKVIQTVVDKEFERHYEEGGGRLSASAELTIAAGVRTLVTQLASGPDYLLSPPKPSLVPDPDPDPDSTPVSAILSSIEKELDITIDEDGDTKILIDNDGLSAKSEYFDAPDERGKPAGQHLQRATSPLSPKRDKLEEQPVSLHQLRTRAKASQWQSGKSSTSIFPARTQPRSFGLPARPYTPAPIRQQIASGVENVSLPSRFRHAQCQVFHVDFSYAEMHYLRQLARTLYGRPVVDGTRSTLRDLRNILKKVPNMKASLVRIHASGYVGHEPPPVSLTKRSSIDIINFLNDLYSRRLNAIPKSLFVEFADPLAQSEASRANLIPTLLLSREITGNRLGAGRAYQNFMTAVRSNREDYLEPQVEWTNCAGDIMTVSWLTSTDFVCGTTTHSDSHNQQYNKPGNLLLGSAVSHTLRAYPDHRIVRPVVASGDNALDSMVASQDPWLYTSVVSSDYDPTCGLGFTSSFDNTVKAWKFQSGSMAALGAWKHEGRVNFVVASKNGTGTIATGADVPTKAVRVYHLDQSDISGSRYDSYSCARVHGEDYIPSDDWAYYPAAIRWGLAPAVHHLLLVGYSPRSATGEIDGEIPEDKLNTGELCLWDTVTKTQVKVNSAKTQNVFEVAWHPSRASFAACTSATLPVALEKTDSHARTQVRIFEKNNQMNQYFAIKTLDCAAVDINELSIMPNSILYSYIAAAATNGKVYVWDTAGSDLPMCVLEHGAPVEELLGEREREDVGVKFAEWATTPDRLYTGSSDGVVKVWNIRHGKGTLVKDLIEAAAPITCGMFSPDNSKLIIGDGSGRVYLLALENPEDDDSSLTPASTSPGFFDIHTNGNRRAIRRPRPFIPHPEPPAPGASAYNQSSNMLMEGQERASQYLNNAQLVLHPDPTVGVVQGRNYSQIGLFRREAHIKEDPNEPLLPSFENLQQGPQRMQRQARRRNWLLRQPKQDAGQMNTNISLAELSLRLEAETNDSDAFDEATLLELKAEKAEFDDSLVELNYETSIFDSDEDDAAKDKEDEFY